MRSKGMRDMLPADMQTFRRIEGAFLDVCLGWGYHEVRTPTIEHLYLFTQAGTLSPQMLDRVYSFLDWDGWTGERVVLRPDSTIPAVRLFVENLDGASAKLFYVQNVFRFDPGDETREDWQFGVELLGDTFPRGDIELVLLAREVIDSLGVNTTIELSHPGIVRSVLDRAGLSRSEQLAVYERVLSGDLDAFEEVEEKLPGSASIHSLLATKGEGPDYIENLRTVLATDIPGIGAPLAELQAVATMLSRMGLAHQIAPLGVRSFEYYTGPVFSLYAGDKRVGGGGRYDALVGLVGRDNVPASGFAIDHEALAPLLPPAGARPEPVTIRCESEAALSRAFALARELRQGSTSVQVVSGAPAGGREVVVSEAGYTLALNGGSPLQLSDIADVVRELSRP